MSDEEKHGLVFGYILDKQGGGRAIDWREVLAWKPDAGLLMVTQEEQNTRIADQMNRTLFRLSIVATIFLPLGLITGLLGINVAGIPGSDYLGAFFLVCTVLVLIGFGEYLIFKRNRWL